MLTTENVYFLTASHGFSKAVYPIKNVNGMKTEMAYLYITYGRTDHIYSVVGWKEVVSLCKIISIILWVARLPLLFYFLRRDSMQTRCYDGKNGNTSLNTRVRDIERKALERNVRLILQD